MTYFQNQMLLLSCAPLTPETDGMFDDAAFEKMQSHALLINVTRGKIVDGPALLRAPDFREHRRCGVGCHA